MRFTPVLRLAALLFIVIAGVVPAFAVREDARGTTYPPDPDNLAVAYYKGYVFTLTKLNSTEAFIHKSLGTTGITGQPLQGCNAEDGGELIEAYGQLHTFASRAAGGICHWWTNDGSAWLTEAPLDPQGSTGRGVSAALYRNSLFVFSRGRNGGLRTVVHVPDVLLPAWQPADLCPGMDDSSTRIESVVHRDRLHVLFMRETSGASGELADCWFQTTTGGNGWHITSGLAYANTGSTFDASVYRDQLHLTYIGVDAAVTRRITADGTSWTLPDYPGGRNYLPRPPTPTRLRTVEFNGELHIYYGAGTHLQRAVWNQQRGSWGTGEIDRINNNAGSRGLTGLAVARSIGVLDVVVDGVLRGAPIERRHRWTSLIPPQPPVPTRPPVPILP